MKNDIYGGLKTEIQFEEMERYAVIVLILGDNDSKEYDLMLKVNSANLKKSVKAVVINCRNKTSPIPLLPKEYKTVHVLDEPLSDMKLHLDKVNLSMETIIEKVFSGYKEAVIGLYSILVGEDFAQRREMFRTVKSKVEVERKPEQWRKMTKCCFDCIKI